MARLKNQTIMSMSKASKGNSLQECLDELRHILGYSMLFGGREVTQARELERRGKIILAPEDPAAWEAEARAFIAVQAPIISKNKTSTIERQEQADAAAARHLAAREAHFASVAAQIAEQDLKRKAQMRQGGNRDGG